MSGVADVDADAGGGLDLPQPAGDRFQGGGPSRVEVVVAVVVALPSAPHVQRVLDALEGLGVVLRHPAAAFAGGVLVQHFQADLPLGLTGLPAQGARGAGAGGGDLELVQERLAQGAQDLGAADLVEPAADGQVVVDVVGRWVGLSLPGDVLG